MGSDAAIRYLKSLNVTAVELLPVHYHADDRHLVDKGLVNYWGYNTLGFFAPHHSWAARSGHPEDAVREFKTMVRNLHAAGIEVILDVVYNHTAEGNQLGPTLSFRGIDNAAYYLLSPESPRHYMDFTGCGNTFNMRNPRVLQLIMDSLRYWITEMHIDGFRFDLASTLARELYEVDKLGGFFDIIHQDPIISQVKLIAEPWDLGEGVTRSATFRSFGANGTANTAIACADSGRATAACSANLRRASAGRATCTKRPIAGRMQASTLSPPTMGFASTISSRTITSTTKRTAKTIATGRTTTSVGTAASKGRPTIRDQPTPPAQNAQLPSDADSLARNADACCRRRVCPHAARQQ